MSALHIVLTADQIDAETPEAFIEHSTGYTRWSMVDHTGPAVHTGFGINVLEAGGVLDTHLHSFEESFYVLEGEAVCETPEAAARVVPGDYGVIAVGAPHRWHNPGDAPVRWVDMSAPQPQPEFEGDTFFIEGGIQTGTPIDVDPRDPRTRSFGHIDGANMDPSLQTQDMLAVSASMRTALLVYSGITVKMMVDSDLGAHLQTMFMVQYEPRGLAGAHDHPLEETYLILEGEVDAWFDGEHYRMKPGDMAFAGVGCVHEFRNPTDGIVRWLETQAPQPPARHSYRFARDWNYLGEVLD
jgi:quercetin dioxygenase-like cupin family protein